MDMGVYSSGEEDFSAEVNPFISFGGNGGGRDAFLQVLFEPDSAYPVPVDGEDALFHVFAGEDRGVFEKITSHGCGLRASTV